MRIPKINSIYFGGISIGLMISLIIPLIIWLIKKIVLWPLVIIGGIILLAFFIFLAIEHKQDFGKIPHYEQGLAVKIPFDPNKQCAVVRCSICTGEKVAGFKSLEDGSITEVMLIKNDDDLKRFKKIYHLDDVKKEY